MDSRVFIIWQNLKLLSDDVKAHNYIIRSEQQNIMIYEMELVESG